MYPIQSSANFFKKTNMCFCQKICKMNFLKNKFEFLRRLPRLYLLQRLPVPPVRPEVLLRLRHKGSIREVRLSARQDGAGPKQVQGGVRR